MQKILPSSVVTLAYQLFDASDNTLLEPKTEVVYLHSGFNEMFTSVEECLDGKSLGDKIKVTMEPDAAFGIYDKNLVFQESLQELAEQIGVTPSEIYVGLSVAFMGIKEKTTDAPLATLTKLSGDTVTLDANHPHAGRKIRFEAEVLGVREATADELHQGRSLTS